MADPRHARVTGPLLITGATGFVGRHLTARLDADGIAWSGLDRPAQVQAADRPDRLTSWELGGPDSDAPQRLARLIGDGAVGGVVHLAGQSSAGASFGDPAGTMRANLGGTLELLEALRALQAAGRPVPVTLVVGSAEEYGAAAPRADRCREDQAILPISPYGTSKAAATLLCGHYRRAFGLPVIAARAFSHTGPGQDERFVFPSFAAQIAAIEAGRADPVIRVGDLSPDRDYLDVRDVVHAYLALLASGEPGRIYNVCSGSSLTIRQGLEILLGLSSVAVRIESDPARLRPVDIPRLVGDPSRLEQATGWTPRVDFADTLRDLLEAARRNLI
ncbi:MAG: GDP-mannose 4,6-dehydratase [Candidatus Krumholzibacteriia bacterium]